MTAWRPTGVVFENAYAHVPLTLPSHVTMLSGRLPYENGVRSNSGYRLERGAEATLPRLLAARGHATGGAVSACVLRGSPGLGSILRVLRRLRGLRAAGDDAAGRGRHRARRAAVDRPNEPAPIPLILELPKRALAARRVAEPVQLVELVPTLAAAAGAEIPKGLPGISLLDSAHGKSKPDRAIYSETLYPRLHFGWSQLRSLRRSAI